MWTHLPPLPSSLSLPLSPSLFHPLPPTDSAWAVYILPEEVGSRCNMIGMHILLLKGGVPHRSVGKLEIVHLVEPKKPIVTWDRDKMRRTGKTGNLVFIEIGRRCQGGEGLVWMYCGFEEATSLWETIYRLVIHLPLPSPTPHPPVILHSPCLCLSWSSHIFLLVLTTFLLVLSSYYQCLSVLPLSAHHCLCCCLSLSQLLIVVLWSVPLSNPLSSNVTHSSLIFPPLSLSLSLSPHPLQVSI